MKKSKILVIFGTRPEAIKMAPVVLALRKHLHIETAVCVTGQHREMLDQVLSVFNIKPDFDINVMTDKQQLASISAKILLGVTNILEEYKPSVVLVHGDTTTSFISSLAAFYLQIPVTHVEAGLRTHNIYSPWPEEFNRRSIGSIATLHFAPTQESEENLLAEFTPKNNIEVTGNTVIDAVRLTSERLRVDNKFCLEASSRFNGLDSDLPIVLVTAHRRENLEGGIHKICEAIAEIADTGQAQFVFPVHKNPRVQTVVHEQLSNKKNIILTPPLDYPEVINLMTRSHILLTDSGGIQEEAAYLRKPCLVMRDTTERPELVNAGGAKLVGTDPKNIINAVLHLLQNQDAHRAMQIKHNPYGDGFAAERIATRLTKFLSK
ncbi:non-hydrolyzing UDP-N-acetylglucosamine 2-epimerase [Craterilacuibacter sinensis]|uniref:UDP-N-acetylglucosamine 2-epimerase (non-hydrolyzing) n=1 Tax=Craterilacuibacter sinensis TaxID=2686017 RepID=A0A845BMS8_9NEIS|nr:UDP-N-acetylglucosamine 2-epimerase (non-hydrolyzing) [Craterilacuibacter sinensis]MXR37655.1 UDP-N-acetylglucosamine 2-epimerase (non-hydrolyzing) [Craterilacuibacter sinensis]